MLLSNRGKVSLSKNIDTVSHRACFGCGACAAKCPFSAITMRTSPDGFEYPVVDAADAPPAVFACVPVRPKTKSTRTRRPFAPLSCRAMTRTSSRKVRPAASSPFLRNVYYRTAGAFTAPPGMASITSGISVYPSLPKSRSCKVQICPERC
ncbi:MAG: 4Fe-4S binding protein [Collinsella sp.]